MESTIIFENVTFDIVYDFIPSEPRVYNYGDGSGYAGSEAQVDIHSIEIAGFEVYDIIHEYIVDKLYDLLIESHE